MFISSSFFPPPICRQSLTPPAGPTFYVDLASASDSSVKEAMEGANIQVSKYKFIAAINLLFITYLESTLSSLFNPNCLSRNFFLMSK